MNDHTQRTTDQTPDLTPELASVAAALDHLARAERDAMPAGLADRVYFRTAALLRSDTRVHHGWTLGWGVGFRIAAIIAVGALGVVSLMGVPASPSRAGNAGGDWLAASADEPWNPIASSTLADMQSELNALDSALDAFWSTDTDWLDEEWM